MEEYSFHQLEKQVRQQPQLLSHICEFINYLTSASCKRLAEGKSEAEFANVLVFILEDKKLSPELAKFVTRKIFPYLEQKATKQAKQKLTQVSGRDLDGDLAILKEIFDSGSRSGLLGWFKEKLTPDDETLVSSATTKKTGKRKKEQAEDETLVTSPARKASQDKKAASNQNGDDETIAVSGEKKKSKKSVRIHRVRKDSGSESSMQGDLLQLFNEETIHSASGRGGRLGAWNRLTAKLNLRSQTVLSTASPLVDQELETLRVQTLVALNASGTLLSYITLPRESDLLKARPQDILKILKGIAAQSSLDKAAWEFLNKLKVAINVRNKLLSERQIIVNIINQGLRSFHHTLDKLARLTTNKKLNRKLWEYLHYFAEQDLIAHAADFRKELERCRTCDELDSFLTRYTMESRSVFRKYSDLEIIRSVKRIKYEYDRKPKKLMRIMNRHLGANGEANIKDKLSQLLLTSAADADIFDIVRKEKNLRHLLARLEKLSQRKLFSDSASSLANLLRAFVDSSNKFSFLQFKTSLNSLAPVLRNTILAIARHSLKQELTEQIGQILREENDVATKLEAVIYLFADPRYHDNLIQLYGHPVKTLEEKIQSISSTAPDLERLVPHVFSGSQMPKKMLRLIIDGKKARTLASQKTVDNCLQALIKLELRLNKREILNLRNELTNLFKSFGFVTFSSKTAPTSISGYDIANMIAEYYNDPARSTIELPNLISSRVRSQLKRIIEDDRARQLKKMGHNL